MSLEKHFEVNNGAIQCWNKAGKSFQVIIEIFPSSDHQSVKPMLSIWLYDWDLRDNKSFTEISTKLKEVVKELWQDQIEPLSMPGVFLNTLKKMDYPTPLHLTSILTFTNATGLTINQNQRILNIVKRFTVRLSNKINYLLNTETNVPLRNP